MNDLRISRRRTPTTVPYGHRLPYRGNRMQKQTPPDSTISPYRTVARLPPVGHRLPYCGTPTTVPWEPDAEAKHRQTPRFPHYRTVAHRLPTVPWTPTTITVGNRIPETSTARLTVSPYRTVAHRLPYRRTPTTVPWGPDTRNKLPPTPVWPVPDRGPPTTEPAATDWTWPTDC